MLFASIWDSFLAQALVLLLYTATLSIGKEPVLFLQGGLIENFQRFLQEMSWFQ